MRKDYNLAKRRFVIAGFLLLIVGIYVYRLYNLQIADNKYKESAENNAFVRNTIYPARGVVYDREGRLIVYNEPCYDLMLIPNDVADFDTVALCNLLKITPQNLDSLWVDMKDRKKNPGYSSYTPQKLVTQLSTEDYGRIQEQLYRFPGFFIQSRNTRKYNVTCGANILGNIREVSQDDLDRDSIEHYYQRGDYTGDMGIERSYEEYLRGRKGVEVLMRDVHGRIQGKYENGIHDVTAKPGHDLTLAIDMELQAYGEELMRGKRGAIVAIEPETGEVLCLVTSPTYEPGLLVGKERGKNYAKLVLDTLKPLYNRAIQGMYPPGSTFKPSQGLIFLQEGIITTGTAYPCSRGYINGMRVGCHGHSSPLTLIPALETSCNAFFCWGFWNMIDKNGKNASAQLTKWKDYMVDMGYGYPLGIDLPHEKRGFIPNSEYYDKMIKARPWTANMVVSVSIGQGEILATPLQIANLCATIANRGWYIAPHIVKAATDTTLNPIYTKRHKVKINKEHYDAVAKGMHLAVTGSHGTCRRGAIPGIDMAGKTGTAQNPHGKDHSAFMGFAPFDEPKIAVAVYVENGGFGADYGVPIGSLIIEKYLTGKTVRPDMENRMKNSRTI